MHENGWLNFPGHWLSANLFTGLAYLWIAHIIRGYMGFVRDEYMKPFAYFIAACGLHHLWMSVVPLLPVAWFGTWQLVMGGIDAVMAAVSLLVAGYVTLDWRRIQGRNPRG